MISFAIPGTGVQTIAPASPLPAITNPVVIDGTTQPGYAGTPLIALSGQAAGGFDALTISSYVSVRSLAIDSYHTTENEQVLAIVQPVGVTTRLLFEDSQGHVLMQSDGQSPENQDNLIDINVPAGSYSLEIQNLGGAGTYTLTTTLTPATAPLQPLPLGAEPFSIVAGDFSGNGHLDLAVVNSGYYGSDSDSTVSVLLGNGDGTFQPQVTYAVGVDPVAIVAGDFSGDGHLDLAVVNSGTYGSDGTVSVLLGNGDGTFQPQVTYAVGGEPLSIVAGDFNAAGRLDLAVSDSDGVQILMANGDGTFQPARTVAGGEGYLVAGDFTGNGHLDLVDSGQILIGNGDGTFQPAKTVLGGIGGPMVAGDFTGDGHLDLAAANWSDDTVSVSLGNGDGTFQPQVTYAVGSNPSSLVAGDFSGNGHLDLAVADSGSNVVSILRGNGDGTFQPAVSSPAGDSPATLVAGDINGDGRLDLAVVYPGNYTYSSSAGLVSFSAGRVSILLGNGDGTFQPQFPAGNAVAIDPVSIVTGDFTGNGFTDLATVNETSDEVSVLIGNGDGTFQPQVTYPVGWNPVSIVAGDFNGDGRLDLAVANAYDNTVSVLLGNGDGTFQPAVTYALGSNPDSYFQPVVLVAGDFNGDGHLDLAVTDSSAIEGGYGTDSPGTVSILLGNGDGTFQSPETFPVGIFPTTMVAGDFNGDGKLDLFIAGYTMNSCCEPSYGSVLLGNGDGTFQSPETFALGIFPSTMVAGDFNGDGRLDLAVVGQADGNGNGSGVSILLGNGDGTFQSQVFYAVGSTSLAASIVAGDFKGDGRLDLAVASDGTVSVLLGNGDGTFQPVQTYATGNDPLSLVAGDFNGDGRLDLAIAGDNAVNFVGEVPEGLGTYTTGEVSVLLGNGDGTFTDAGQFATTPHATPLMADFSGDGAADMLVVDAAGNILYRQGIPGQPGSFEPPVIINPGEPSRNIALVSTGGGFALASVDARGQAVSLWAWHDGGFVRIGLLSTGRLPAQVVSADLNGNGLSDLVVRNAGDGTLSVFFATRFIGPVDPGFMPLSFLTPVTLPVGLGVSDVQVIDTTGSGLLDLVVTNRLTGLVSILRNLGGGAFASPAPYRSGAGLSEIDTSSGSPEVTSLDATAGVVAGPLTPGAPTDLLTINPGSETIGVLAGLGNGRFANPVTLYTGDAPQVVRVADFTGNGIDDLAVLAANGVSIYLGNGKGGFAPPVTYGAGADPTGLTVADLLGNGKLDLLVGNDFGDVLILVGNGDGTFRPFEPVKAAIALAVADLTGNGVLDFVFADQSLNQVSVVYGSTSQNWTSPQVIGNQTTGVLAPGAVLLHDMNGDGIPDLIVANSGGNNVLVYPGLGNGQFGPPIGGTQGFAVGTDPTGLTVANLNGQPDLLVADTGSNDVSVLLGQGKGASWTMISGARVQTDAGPVATVVGNLLGGNNLELAVANSGANNVQVFPSVGSGFFNNQPTATYTVGQDPLALFLGDFSGLGLGLATLNAGSNNGTLISNAGSANPVIQSFATGGNSPTTGFAGDFGGNGLTDLVVGNNGDGHLALLLGGSGGLSLSQSLSSPAAPNPTAVSFGGVTDGVLSFYVSTAGHDAALEMAFNLSAAAAIIGPGTAPLLGVSSVPGATILEVARLGDVTGSAFDLIATLVTLTILPENLESELESGGGGAALLASFSPGGSTGLGQSIGVGRSNDGSGGGEPEVTNPANAAGPGGTGQASTPVDRLAPWAQFAVGLDQAWQELRARLVPGAVENGPAPGSGSPRIQSQAPSRLAPQADPSRSEPKSRSGSRDATTSPLPIKSQEPSGAATNGVWRSQPGAGVSVSLSSRAGFPPVLAAVDAALEDLGESLPRSNKLLRIVPPATDERTDSAVQDMMEIAAASMAMSMTWERAVVAGRGRREARRAPQSS